MSNGEAEKPYQCEYCGRRFTAQTELGVHFDVHIEERPYPCTSCSKRFVTEKALSRHASVHAKTKKIFSCDTCGQSFRRRVRLEAHTRIHTGEMPYKCDHCGETFRVQKKLNKHIGVTHREKIEYSCEICHKLFDKKIHLRDHMTSHAADTPCERCDRGLECGGHFYRRERICRECGQRFERWHDLTKHVKKYHRKEQRLARRKARTMRKRNATEDSPAQEASAPLHGSTRGSPVDWRPLPEFGVSHRV